MKPKKRRINPWTIPAVVVVMLALATGFYHYFAYMGHAYMPSTEDEIGQVADVLQLRLDEDGVQQSAAHLEAAVQSMGDEANAVVIDAQGAILYSTNKLHIEERDTIRLMISNYAARRKEWEYKGEPYYAYMPLALFVDENGGVVKSFGALATPSCFGEDLPRYQEYFPTIDEDSGEWESEAPARDSDNVIWASRMFQNAGARRLTLRTLRDGSSLLLLYVSDDVFHASEIRRVALYSRVEISQWALLALLGAFILILAAWVYTDAKRRDFKPALWGVLTLIGNGIAWIVYLMVRPGGRSMAACPGCGTTPKPSYAFCPVCGHALLSRCKSCGKPLEDAFHFCTGCGAHADEHQ